MLRIRKTVLARAAVTLAAGLATVKLSTAASRKLSRTGTKVTLELTGRHATMAAVVKRLA